MKIQVGKYTLNSDSYCMWITEEREINKGKNKGNVRNKRMSGYARTFRFLLNSFVSKKVMGSDAESLEDLLKLLEQIMADIEEVNRAAFEHDFGLLKRTAERQK